MQTSAVALSFMVQEPREIMEVLSDRSLFSSFFRYLVFRVYVVCVGRGGRCEQWLGLRGG